MPLDNFSQDCSWVRNPVVVILKFETVSTETAVPVFLSTLKRTRWGVRHSVLRGKLVSPVTWSSHSVRSRPSWQFRFIQPFRGPGATPATQLQMHATHLDAPSSLLVELCQTDGSATVPVSSSHGVAVRGVTGCVLRTTHSLSTCGHWCTVGATALVLSRCSTSVKYALSSTPRRNGTHAINQNISKKTRHCVQCTYALCQNMATACASFWCESMRKS